VQRLEDENKKFKNKSVKEAPASLFVEQRHQIKHGRYGTKQPSLTQSPLYKDQVRFGDEIQKEAALVLGSNARTRDALPSTQFDTSSKNESAPQGASTLKVGAIRKAELNYAFNKIDKDHLTWFTRNEMIDAVRDSSEL
jgi:hypothetical protein